MKLEPMTSLFLKLQIRSTALVEDAFVICGQSWDFEAKTHESHWKLFDLSLMITPPS